MECIIYMRITGTLSRLISVIIHADNLTIIYYKDSNGNRTGIKDQATNLRRQIYEKVNHRKK